MSDHQGIRRLVTSFAALIVGLLSVGPIIARPPNFVIILADDLGYGDLGVYGNRVIRTPRIDRMAAEGVRLTEFYSVAPSCTPARAALLTGRYPYRSGLTRVLVPKEKWGLPASEVTLGEALQGEGYATACIGKWHLGGRKVYRPSRHGFDVFYGVLFSNDMALLPWVKWPRFQLLSGDRVVESRAKVKYLTRNYTEQAIRFLEANRERPFFLYLAYTMPHVPQAASEPFRGQSAHGVYGDAVEEIDWSVGQVLDSLDRLELSSDTLLVFTSDNGPWVRGSRKKKIKGGSAFPLRGSKGTTWEGGVRVPMIARWPERLPRGEVRDGVATLMDLFPTFIELAGGALPQDREIDGRDILGFLRGAEGSPHKQFYYYDHTRIFAVRSGDWKLHLWKRELARRGKLKQPVRCDPPELYNLREDPGERLDRAAEHPEITARLREDARAFHDSITPVMRLPTPKKAIFKGVLTPAPKTNSLPR